MENDRNRAEGILDFAGTGQPYGTRRRERAMPSQATTFTALQPFGGGPYRDSVDLIAPTTLDSFCPPHLALSAINACPE
jgi:hypothetical protein